MLRFGRFVVHDNLERCLDALGGVRDACSVAAVGSGVRQSHAGGSTSRSNCLIDLLARRATARAIQRDDRRRSSTSAVKEIQRTCLYDFHVEKRGESWLCAVSSESSLRFGCSLTRCVEKP